MSHHDNGPRRLAGPGLAARIMVQAATLGVAVVLAVSVLAQAQGPAPDPECGYFPDLGLYRLALPAGTHYVTLPLVPGDSDLLHLLGPDLYSLSLVESWDPSAAAFCTVYPGLPGSLTGDVRLCGPVLRITAPRPVLLSLRGSPPPGGWSSTLRSALGSQFFGPATTSEIALGDLVSVLESTGRFVKGRDSLWCWNLDQAGWVDLRSADPATVVRPGATFSLGATPPAPSPTPAPTASPVAGAPVSSVASLDRQPDLGTGNMLDAEGNPVTLDGYQVSQTTVQAPAGCTIGQCWSRKGGSSDDSQIATMTLPASLLAMTDLPRVVPVRISFTTDSTNNVVPQMFEILSVQSMRIGGKGRSTVLTPTLTVTNTALSLAMDVNGNLFGAGRTDLSALKGMNADLSTGTPQGSPTTVPACPVSICYEPTTTQNVFGSDGSSVPCPGPLIQVALRPSGTWQAYTRWGPSNAPLPPSNVRTEVAPGIFATTGWWVEQSPALGKVLDAATVSPWTTWTLPATLRTTDGQTVCAVDGGQVSKAGVTKAILGRFRIDPLEVSPGSPKVIHYYPTGLARIQLGTNSALDVFGTEFGYVLSNDSDTLEFEVIPTVTLGSGVSRGLALQGTLAPTLVLRGHNMVEAWEDLIVYGRPIVTTSLTVDWSKLDCKVFGRAREALVKKILAGNAKAIDPDAVDPSVGFGPFQLDAYGFALGYASVVRVTNDRRLAFFAQGQRVTSHISGPSSRLVTNSSFDLGLTFSSADGPSLIGGAFHYEKATTLDGTSIVKSLEIDGSYQFPSDSDWAADRTATGQILYVNQQGPQAKRFVNRAVLQLNDPISIDIPKFKPSVWGIKGSDADFVFDMQQLTLSFEGIQQDTTVTRKGAISTSIFGGVTSASDPDGTKGGGVLLCIDDCWESEKDGQPVPNPLSDQSGFLDEFFPGPSPFGKATENTIDAAVYFQNLGDNKVRLDSVECLYSKKEKEAGQLIFSPCLGFRTDPKYDWAQLTGTFEFNKGEKSFSAALDQLQVNDAFTLQDVYISASGKDVKDLWKKIAFGGSIAFSPDDPTGQLGIKVGLDANLGDKTAHVFVDAGSNALCRTTNSADCWAQDVTFDGMVDWSGGKPSVSLNGSFKFLADVGASQPVPFVCAATVSGAPAMKTAPAALTLGAQVSAPVIPLPWGNASLTLSDVGLNVDIPTKAVTGGGSIQLTLPSKMAKVGNPWIQIPQTIGGTITYGSGRVSTTLAMNPPITFSPLSDLSLKIASVSLTKGSPWALAMGGSITAGGQETPCNINYDETAGSLSFVAPPSATISFSLGGGATCTVSGFALTIQPVNGVNTITISGTSTITINGTSYSGTLSLTLDMKGNIQLALSGIKGASYDFGDGFSVAADGLSLSSLVTSSGRTVSTSVTADFTFPSDWPGIGGQKTEGTIQVSSNGDLALTVDTNIDLGLKGLPIELDIERFVIKRTSGKLSVEGEASLGFLRPINTVLGQSGDTPVTMDCTLGLTEDKRILFSAALPSTLLSIPFDLGFASGKIQAKDISVSTGPSLTANVQLALTNPGNFVMTIAGSLQGEAVTFDITCTPPLAVNAVVFQVNLADLSYKQVFPGFMGVGTTAFLQVGVDYLYNFKADLKSLLYILPSSLPPFGFPFFDEVKLGMTILGFEASAGVSLPAPQIPSAQIAISFVKGIWTGFRDGDWDPLYQFLSGTGGDAIRNIFRGPGIGDLALGLPILLKPVFPNLSQGVLFPDAPAPEQVLVLNILTGMHYLTDLISNQNLADGIVKSFQFCQIVGEVFTDPRQIVQIVPPSKRTGSVDLSFAGSAGLSGAYSIQPPQDIMASGQAAGIPAFSDLATLADWVENGSNLPSIPSIVSMQSQPVSTSFSFTSDAGAAFAGRVDDQWVPLRQYVTAALTLMNDACVAGQPFSMHHALSVHLKKMVGEHGGIKTEPAQLVSGDGKVVVSLFGSSAPFQVKVAGTTVYTGSASLTGATTAAAGTSSLSFTGTVQTQGTQLFSVVTATFTPEGEKSQDLGEVSRTLLKDFSTDDPPGGPSAPTLVGWIVTYQLDDKGAMHAQFTDYGTVKFDAPYKEFTTVYQGSVLGDLRLAIHQMELFKTAIFACDTSPYMLGQTIWSQVFNDPNISGMVDQVVSAGRQVNLTFLQTDVTMAIVLEQIAYYLTPPGQMPTDGTQTASLSASTDLDQYELKNSVLVARPFVVSVQSGGGTADTTSVNGLVIFDGGPEMAQKIAACQQQAASLKQSDISKLEGMGLSALGDPMIVKSLRVDVAAGQVKATIRPRDLVFTRQVDGAQLLEITPGNVGTMDQLENGGPYGDPSPYPSSAGTFFVNSTIPASPTTASTSVSTAVTTTLDLYAALGANILTRTVTAKQPATIVGAYTEMAPGQLQGQVPGGGGFTVTGDSVTGMTAVLQQASPAPVTMNRTPLGSRSGTVPYAGAPRKLTFDTQKGVVQTDFTYPTGQTIPGGFMATVDLSLTPPLALLDVYLDGEIKFDGSFHFEGSAKLAVLSHTIEGGGFILDSHDGLTVWGDMGTPISTTHLQGNVSAHGASFLGDVDVGTNGTGIFALMSIDTNGSPPMRIHGDMKIAGYTITTADLTIGSDGTISIGWDASLGCVSLEASLAFRFSGGVSVSGSFGVAVHTWLGTIHASFDADIDSNGNFCVGFHHVNLCVNIPHGNVSVKIK